MKKKLEADLISIAHRILQLKDKSDVNQLFLETQKLYEKLAVLRFVEEHFSDPKPTIGQAEVVEKMKEFFENIAVPEFPKAVPSIQTISEESTQAEIIEEAIAEPIKVEAVTADDNTIAAVEETEITTEELPTSVVPEPLEETKESETISAETEEEAIPVLEKTEVEPLFETVKKETPAKKEIVQISFDDLLGGTYTDPDFVKVSPSDKKKETIDDSPTLSFGLQDEPISNASQAVFEKAEPKSITLNDKLAKEINIGLNDRIAFVKHLFGGNNEDYNRVVSQLITFDNFPETKSFIDEMVKPDYNNWEGKEEYEHRFMEIIEKKFLSF